MQYLEELNPKQREAAECLEGPLMILAGAGAGKTKTITHRIAHLITNGVPADSILAVTFTNKAAGEMRERVRTLLETLPQANFPLSIRGGGATPFVATFHSLGVHLLRANAARLAVPRSFSIWDRADSMRATKAAMKELGIEKQYEPKMILGAISRKKGDAITLARFREHVHSPWDEAVAEVWGKYETLRRAEGAFDFDDLLLETLTLLRDDEGARRSCHLRWSHILIDEYQDTNAVQYELAQILSAHTKNICVVGDIDQNIYSWRGADISHLLSFEHTYPDAKIVLLEENYRSTKTILAAADDIIKLNKNRYDKTLFTNNTPGDKIEVLLTSGEVEEAQCIASRASELIERGTPPKEIAVLYRANFQSRALEEAFLYAGVPYRVLGTRFFERKEVKDVLSYVRAALNPESNGDIARIIASPPRGIGKQTLTRMLEGKVHELAAGQRARVESFYELLAEIKRHAESRPVSDVIRFIIRGSGLEAHLKGGSEEDQERLENIKELVTLATKYDGFAPLEAAEKLLEDAALATDQDSLDERTNAVSLMTIHASKGLEFDVVFITGMEEGTFPHERHDDSADPEEERRLCYVALTRARKRVILTYAATRMVYGTREPTVPSQFLNDINPDLLSTTTPFAQADEEETIIM